MVNLSLLVHIVGVGLLFAGIVPVWIVESMLRSAVDARSAHLYHKAMVNIGILTPVASAVLLISGVTNIVAERLDFWSQGWLMIKLALFIAMGAIGAIQGKAYRTRGRLVEAIALGDAPATAPADVEMFSRRLSLFNRTQSLLLVLILIVTLFRSYI